jgi:prepilin-type N-terminal cleavage/methylation domain-containing protein
MQGGIMNKGFTLIEVLVAIIILAVGILAVSQMTVMGVRTTTVIKQQTEGREVLTRAFEAIKILQLDDPLLDSTCTYALIDSFYFGHRADSTNVIGQIVNDPKYDVWWNVVPNHPQNRVRTIRLFVRRNNRELIRADFVKWR